MAVPRVQRHRERVGAVHARAVRLHHLLVGAVFARAQDDALASFELHVVAVLVLGDDGCDAAVVVFANKLFSRGVREDFCAVFRGFVAHGGQEIRVRLNGHGDRVMLVVLALHIVAFGVGPLVHFPREAVFLGDGVHPFGEFAAIVHPLLVEAVIGALGAALHELPDGFAAVVVGEIQPVFLGDGDVVHESHFVGAAPAARTLFDADDACASFDGREHRHDARVAHADDDDVGAMRFGDLAVVDRGGRGLPPPLGLHVAVPVDSRRAFVASRCGGAAGRAACQQSGSESGCAHGRAPRKKAAPRHAPPACLPAVVRAVAF